jgi:3-oxoacyl-[acyl-carrier protein] reductase
MPDAQRPLDGAVAIVTGAAQGIGEAIARRLAALGARVCVADLQAEAAQRVAADIGGLGVEVDVRRLDSFQAAAQAAADRLGEPTILVNNAGVSRTAMVHRVSDEDWDLVHDVGLRGVFNGLRAVAPWFRDGHRPGRRVVNISSIAGTHGAVGAAAYGAAKAGVVGLTRVMAQEWARHGVTVNAIAPGYIQTDMSAALKDIVAGRIPIGRPGEPEDVAAAVAFFCSPDAGYITGQVLEVTGGLTDMNPPGAAAGSRG